jgi:hypothetical protein
MAGLSRPKFCLDLQVQLSSERRWKPATAAKPQLVVRQQGTVCSAIQTDFFSAQLDKLVKIEIFV